MRFKATELYIGARELDDRPRQAPGFQELSGHVRRDPPAPELLFATSKRQFHNWPPSTCFAIPSLLYPFLIPVSKAQHLRASDPDRLLHLHYECHRLSSIHIAAGVGAEPER